ncbi:NAD(P)-binding protein [Pimelobacter simplex]|uniref:NAD(P)-binding protein n=1 Tax=Nocardioides simplex TaxID=2045 RepID=A0A7J5DWK7_NOCSI|nr:NAD(P)-binding protein [Pimelobacter simplex]
MAQRLDRRTLLTSSAAVGAGAVLAGTGLAPALAASPGRRAVVLGGGMAGLTAAHELVERGFEVTVFEPSAWGGKARSIPVAGTGTGGRADLPGEHGFRFFPGFYHHVPETMRRIPFGAGTVGDNLVAATGGKFLRAGERADGFVFGIGPDPPAAAHRRRPAPLPARHARRPDRPAAGARLLRRAPPRLPDQLRRAPPGPVGEGQLVGLRRRRPTLEGVPARPRRGPDPQPGRGQGDDRQHPHDRHHGRGVRLQHDGPRQRRCARPGPRPAHQRGLDRPVDGVPAQPGSAPGLRPAPGPVRRRARPGRRGCPRRRLRRHDPGRGRLVRQRDARRARRADADARRARSRARAEGARHADHRLDGGHPALPARARQADPRAHHLPRRPVVADRPHPGPVLGRPDDRPRLRRRRGRRHPLDRHLQLGRAGHPLRQDRQGVHARRDRRRGARPGPGPPHGRRPAARGDRALLVPRPRRALGRRPAPQHQRDAAARQHRRLLVAAPDRPDRRAEPDDERRLRADRHRPGHHGGRQRVGAPRGQRHPRRVGLVGGAGHDVPALRPAGVHAAQADRPAALQARPAQPA